MTNTTDTVTAPRYLIDNAVWYSECHDDYGRDVWELNGYGLRTVGGVIRHPSDGTFLTYFRIFGMRFDGSRRLTNQFESEAPFNSLGAAQEFVSRVVELMLSVRDEPTEWLAEHGLDEQLQTALHLAWLDRSAAEATLAMLDRAGVEATSVSRDEPHAKLDEALRRTEDVNAILTARALAARLAG